MNYQPDFFIYDKSNYFNDAPIVRNKSKSNWNLRKTLQAQHLEPLPHKGPSQTPNVPHTYKNIHDNNHPPIGNPISDMKSNFIQKERFQNKLIAPSINVNLKIPRI